eukprot:40493-Chlamydomonas_euryale.AAC.7
MSISSWRTQSVSNTVSNCELKLRRRRSTHNAGFVQPLHDTDLPVPNTKYSTSAPGTLPETDLRAPSTQPSGCGYHLCGT